MSDDDRSVIGSIPHYLYLTYHLPLLKCYRGAGPLQAMGKWVLGARGRPFPEAQGSNDSPCAKSADFQRPRGPTPP